MKILRTLSLVVLPAVLLGCSKSEQKPASPTGGGAPRVEFNSLSDLPADLRSDLESFARQFESDSHNGETNAIRRTFDLTAITDAVHDGIQANAALLGKFKTGYKEGLLKSVGALAAGWAQESTKFKGLVLYRGSPAARFRFTMDDAGIAIVDLVLHRNARGEVRIVNFCNHAMGYDMVEQSRQMIAPLVADMDKGFLERLVNKPNVNQKDMMRFGEMAKSLSRRDFAGVVRNYKELPTALQDTKPATTIYITALQNLGDDEQYKQALKQAGARLKSASFQFMLVDAYFLDKEFDKAIECIDNFMQALEQDAALLTLKSLMLNAKGDAKSAVNVLRDALKLEPDCVFAHSKGLDVLLAAKDFAGARDSMVFLEDKGGYSFKDAMDDPLWDEFKKAPESKRWR